jgi:hypothetical protein
LTKQRSRAGNHTTPRDVTLGTLGAELLFRRINGEIFEPVTVVLSIELCPRGIQNFPMTDNKEPE